MKRNNNTKTTQSYRPVSNHCDTPGIVFWSATAMFGLMSMTLLELCSSHYLTKLEEMSYFGQGEWYWHLCMESPGGLVDWAASFLTQFFYYPWLGASLLTTALCGLAILAAKSFGLKGWTRLGALALPALMLLFMLMPGYLVFTAKTPGFAWTGVLGFAASSAIVWIFRSLSHPFMKLGFLVVCTGLYPLFGFYALFGVWLCIVNQCSSCQRWWIAVGGLLLIVCVPQVYFYFAESHTLLSHLYTMGVPRMAEDTQPLMYCYLGAVILMTLWSAAPLFSAWSDRHQRVSMAVGVGVLAFSLGGVPLLRYTDANFSTELAMDEAMRNGDFARALEYAAANEETPNRAINLLTHASLLQLGEAGDRMFSFRMGDRPYNTPYVGHGLRMVGARPVYYYFGRINDSYRWSMEDMVEFGPKVEYLRYLSKIALLNGEYELAKRYLHKLGRTAFHRDFAQKYMDYAHHPDKMDRDPEFAKIRPLTYFADNIGGDAGMIETYISHTTAGMAAGSDALVELSLQFNLVQKNIAGFWARFSNWLATHPGHALPKHYQEAAILFSTLENEVDWHELDIDPQTASRFDRFMDMARQNAGFSEEYNSQAFSPQFGDTYWYYYFFVNNLKTT